MTRSNAAPGAWLRRALVALIVATAWALLPSGAQAATHDVEAETISFIPDQVDISVGDSVRWVWTSGPHDLYLVQLDENGDPVGSPANLTTQCPLMVVCMQDDPPIVQTFNAPGQWRFYCTIHGGNPQGDGMQGVITVSSGGPPPDTTPPSTTASLDPASPGPGGTYTVPVTLTLSAEDDEGGSGVDYTEYSLNGGATWNEYTQPLEFDENGSYTVLYRSVDNEGNVEPVKQITFTVAIPDPDTTAPTTTHQLNPAPNGQAGWHVTSPVQVTLSAQDDEGGSGVDVTEYRIGTNGSFQTYTGPIQVSAQGSTTVQYRSRDNAGNVEETKSVEIKIDTVAPSTSASLSPANPGPGGTYAEPVTVSLAASDATSGVAATEYRVGTNGAFQPYTEPLVFDDNGSVTVQFRSRDAAGNEEQVQSVSFTVAIPEPDTTAPTTTASLSPASPGPGGTYTVAPTLTLTAQDNEGGSGVDYTEYRVNGGAWTTYSNPVKFTVNGEYEVDYRSVDNAGNVEDTKTIAFAVEIVPTGGVPENIEPPTITGNAKVGNMLTCERGTWTSTGSYSYTWLRDGVEVPTGTGAGETGSTNPARYRVQGADIGHEIACAVTRTNKAGSSEPAESEPVTVQGDGPANTSPPVLSGSGKVGTMLTCDRGEWTGSGGYTYTWLRDGVPVAVGTGAGQTGSTNPARYRAKADEVGAQIVCRVTRTDGSGASASADSNAVVITAG